eukprot:m.429181 g.429181  ORF g.429181 m.429181 type:complete len:455 (-) comp16972_c0_seq1:423-1787(-)
MSDDVRSCPSPKSSVMGADYSGFVAAAAVAFLAASHYTQKWLPAPKPRIVGIDLGTTYSCVGVYQAGKGEVQILADPDGRRTIPSVVGYIGAADPVVGAAAKANATMNPTNTIYEAKRFIGKTYAAVQDDIAGGKFSFVVIDNSGQPAFQVRAGAGEGGTVELRLVTPEDVGAAVLKTLKATAEHHLGQGVTQAVMSVPVEFNQRQRDATAQAAALAGLDVLRILSEPTAAAMAYGLHSKEAVNFIVVFDWGGGTLDVSLLHVQGGMFTTHAIAGNKHLGGEDVTRRLFDYCLRVYSAGQPEGYTPSPELRQRFRAEAERLKLALSTKTHDTLEVDVGGGERFTLDVTREKFEEVNVDLFEATMEPLHAVLREAELEPSKVDEIVLVGGSTRMPWVRERLAAFLGKPPCSSIDPDEAVAVGVAMQAGIIAGAWPLQVSALEMPFRPDDEGSDDS